MALGSRLKYLLDNISAGKKTKINHKVQITSFGGTGTTFLISFFKEKGLYLPKEADCGIWKHMRLPPTKENFVIPDRFRVLYVTGNPLQSILSLFRRNLQGYHIERIGCKDSNWPKSLEMGTYPPKWGLNEYLEYEKDLYRMEEHFDNWTTSSRKRRGYPILIVKYDSIWENLKEIFDFLGLSKSLIKDFPKRKTRVIENIEYSERILRNLDKIYGDFVEKVDKYSKISVI